MIGFGRFIIFNGKCKGKYAISMDGMGLIFVSGKSSKRLCLDDA